MRRGLPRPRIGEPAPEVTLLDEHGRRWRLADQRGRVTVLIFNRHIH
jgi:peroxiredoxin